MAKGVGVAWSGLEALKAQLKAVSKDFVEEADQIMRDGAEAARNDIVVAYPRGPTGKLKRGVKLRAPRGSGIVGVTLKSTAPHAHLYEKGTKARLTRGQGPKIWAQAWRGRMFSKKGFPGPTFIPNAERHQRLALSLLIARVKAYGAAEVTGQADVGSADARLQ